MEIGCWVPFRGLKRYIYTAEGVGFSVEEMEKKLKAQAWRIEWTRKWT